MKKFDDFVLKLDSVKSKSLIQEMYKILPEYKGNRKKQRKDSKHDWNAIFTMMNAVREEKNRNDWKDLALGLFYANDRVDSVTKQEVTKMSDTQAMAFIRTQVNGMLNQVDSNKKK